MLGRISTEKITEVFLPIGTRTLTCAEAVTRLFEKVCGWNVRMESETSSHD
jgi:hypothetical protein